MRPISEMPLAVRTEKEQLGVDPSFSLPPAVAEIMRDDLFWEGVALSANLFYPLCKCIDVLGSDTATMGTAYKCFLYILDHLNGIIPNYDDQRERAIQACYTAESACIVRSTRWRSSATPSTRSCASI